jgi:hypothetical protein
MPSRPAVGVLLTMALGWAALVGAAGAGDARSGQAPPPPAQPAAQRSFEPPPAPTEAQLGVPVYPGSQFLASYDAGRGQRFYLFGCQASFEQLVAYYKTVLKTSGDLVFDQPPTHMFEVGRFREDTMAFPPGVTVKDYAAGQRGGYLNPTPGGQPPRFPTVIQIVPVPLGAVR